MIRTMRHKTKSRKMTAKQHANFLNQFANKPRNPVTTYNPLGPTGKPKTWQERGWYSATHPHPPAKGGNRRTRKQRKQRK
jgi:hypothetical protein